MSVVDVRVEAVEPDEAMLVEAKRSLADAPVPIHLSRAPVEILPFSDAQFDSVVVTLVFCSVHDPARGMREIWRVLKPGGTLFLLEHVRAQGKITAWIQDALVPLTTRCMGQCHWNRIMEATVLETGLRTTQVRQVSGGLQPMLLLHARFSLAALTWVGTRGMGRQRCQTTRSSTANQSTGTQ